MPITTTLEAVAAWRRFANALTVHGGGASGRTWKEHITAASGRGFADENSLVRPVAFPSFARDLLGFEVGVNLAAERHDAEGAPDFTPADSVTHPFVFELKSSNAGTTLAGHDPQVLRYLHLGAPRIKRVVLTNLVGLRVLDIQDGDLHEQYQVDLRALLLPTDDQRAAQLPAADSLLRFFTEFSYAELTREQKIDRIRRSPSWGPFAVTTADWISNRLDRVVKTLDNDIAAGISVGALVDTSVVGSEQRQWILEELRLLAWRLGGAAPHESNTSIADYLSAGAESAAGKALRQYRAHAACYFATRLMLVRVWEDLGMLEPILYDGGFDKWMDRFDDIISDVVNHAFSRAKQHYKALFDKSNAYSWYTPSPEAQTEALFELANTYFGAIESDVLGLVYERLLERIDRKLLGQYYTPRDIIALIWQLLGIDDVARISEESGEPPRVLDIATGSGGFLVEGARLLLNRLDNQIDSGASVNRSEWVSSIVNNLTGIEIQRFPAYLAEVNLLIQFGRALRQDKSFRLPEAGVITADSLALHNPEALIERGHEHTGQRIVADTPERRDRALAVKNALTSKHPFDIACGNPPYVGQKIGAQVIQRTRDEYPYWEQYVGHHMDYLYWFVLLGVSKLRKGGRFGFITTEYWLRSAGAIPLRRYLGLRCNIERLIVFRKLKLFSDAPGQDSVVIIGQRETEDDDHFDETQGASAAAFPRVTIYDGPDVAGAARANILRSIAGRAQSFGLRSFRAQASRNELLGKSWSSVILSKGQLHRRSALLQNALPLEVDFEQGVVSSANRMRKAYAPALSETALGRIGWPGKAAGIFVLTADEVRDLGELSEAEQDVVKPFINTQDVLPYAAPIPREHDSILYLAAPEGTGVDTPFPNDMENLKAHLANFEPLLREKVAHYGEARPWWVLHRPRPVIRERQAVEGRWADYCVMANWGVGGHILVGLAPRGGIPAQGLNALIPSGVTAAYLCGLLNSTPVQDLAETLPPGYLRKSDFEELALPLIPEVVQPVETEVLTLADLVNEMSRGLGSRFPAVASELRSDITMRSVNTDVWCPAEGPVTSWGPIRDVKWIIAASSGSLSGRVVEVTIYENILFGSRVEARGAHGSILLDVADGSTALALAAFLRGRTARQVTLNQIPDFVVPVDAAELTRRFEVDKGAIGDLTTRYRNGRESIDRLLGDVI